MHKKFKFKESLNVFVDRVHEVGINSYLYAQIKTKHKLCVKVTNEHETVSFASFFGIVLLLIVGCSIGVLAFIVEHLISKPKILTSVRTNVAVF